MVDQHLSQQQMQEFLDDRLGSDERGRIHAHLSVCGQCTEAVQSLKSIDTVLRRMPLEKPGARFTRSVMERIPESSSAAFRLLEYTAYFFGLLIVVAITAAAFTVTGNGNQAATADAGMWGTAYVWIDSAFSAMNTLARQVVSASTMRIAFILVLSVGFLFVLDRLLWRRLGHRS